MSTHTVIHPLAVDVELADVVDALVTLEDRLDGCVLALVLDACDDVVAPIVVEQVPREADTAEVFRLVQGLADIAAHFEHRSGLALGVGRPGGREVTDADRSWLAALHAACREAGVRPAGVAIASPAGVVDLDDDAAAA